MSYSPDVYEVANKKLQILRQKAEHEAEIRKNNLFCKNKKAQQIVKMLSSTPIHIAKSILKGGSSKELLTALKEKNLRLQNELKLILKQEGLAEDYLQVHYNCKNCSDTGYVDGKICVCFKKLLKQETYKQINKLSPLSLSSFENFNLDFYSNIPENPKLPSPKKRMENIFFYCKNYAKNFTGSSKSILMQGATGLGKTHLSLAIANEAINKGYGVVYGSMPNIISLLEKEKFRYKDYNYDNEQHFINCDLLILDDLGTEFSTLFSNSLIYNIINSRIMKSNPTIINTNMSFEELEKSYSERLVSRIAGNYDRLFFLGNDIRIKKNIHKTP